MSTLHQRLIREALKIIGGTTPLAADCGALCGSACCKGEGGMLLLPGEYNMLAHVPNFRFHRIRVQRERVWWMTCDDTCQRSLRPFQCRIYPLGPHVAPDGAIVAVPEPRAVGVCPLHGTGLVQPEFYRRVNASFRHLCLDPALHGFLHLMARDMASV